MRTKFWPRLVTMGALCGAACSPALAEAPALPAEAIDGATREETTLLAQVGSREIRQIDLQQKIEIERIYAGDKPVMSEADAFAMLLREQVECALAESMQFAPTDEECRAAAEHARKNTLQPEKLDAILALFGGDEASANKLFWAPRIANRRLFAEFQSQESELNRGARERAAAILSASRAGRDLREAAQAGQAEFEAVDQPRMTADGYPLKTAADFAHAKPGRASPLLALAQSMVAGETHAAVQETPAEFSVVRLVEKTEENMRFEVVRIPKLRWDAWLKLRARQSARVRVFEPDLAARMRDVSGAWWASQINPDGGR